MTHFTIIAFVKAFCIAEEVKAKKDPHCVQMNDLRPNIEENFRFHKLGGDSMLIIVIINKNMLTTTNCNKICYERTTKVVKKLLL